MQRIKFLFSFSRLVLFLIISILFSSQLKAQWVQTNGPNRADVTCLGVMGTNVFAGSLEHGVYLSTDNGLEWNDANGNIKGNPISALTVVGTKLFVGVNIDGQGGSMYFTTNNGNSSNFVYQGLPANGISAFTVSHKNTGGTNLYAGTGYVMWAFSPTGNGVFLSADTGGEPGMLLIPVCPILLLMYLQQTELMIMLDLTVVVFTIPQITDQAGVQLIPV